MSTPATSSPKQEGRVQAHFDTVAAEYASFYQGGSSEAHSFTTRLRRVLEMLPARVGTLVDIGCGPGILVNRIMNRDGCAQDPETCVLGMDFAANMVRQAVKSEASPGAKRRRCFLRGSAGILPFKTSAVDNAVTMGLMEYLDDEEQVLREIARVLRPGAAVVITLPNRWSPYRLWHRMLNRLFATLRRLFPNSANLNSVEFMVGPFTKGVAHREYSEFAYSRLLRQFELETVQVCGYNFKLFVTPLDKIFPKATVAVSRWLEWLGPIPFVRLLSTAFIIKARRKAWS